MCVVCVRAWLYTCITASEESLSCGLRLHRVLHASASPIDWVGVIMFSGCPSICVCIQSNPLKWIALGLIMSIQLGRISTYPCFILYIVSTWEQPDDIHLTWLSTKRYPLIEV